ncbi:MAG: hypothetical protein ACLQBX_07415 [Candidatus Limnocylindrales bacterium]
MEDRPATPEEQAAAHLDASQRLAVGLWAGDPRVTLVVLELRPHFHEQLDQLGLEDPDEQAQAALRILGIGSVLPNGTERLNFFAAWPEERLALARQIAAGVRVAISQLVAVLRDGAGVTVIAPVEHVPPDEDSPDGLRFRGDHAALLELLWLDIPLEGRSGAEIAGDLPVIGTVGWERDGSVLLIGAGDVPGPDILAGDILRRAFLRHSEHTAGQLIEAPPLISLADGGTPEFTPPARRIDRYRLPGWSDLAELWYLAHQVPLTEPSPGRPKRGPGRPRGPYLIQTRGEIETVYRQLWAEGGHRPYWTEVARALGVDERTLRHARRDFGMDKRAIERSSG